MAMPRPKNQPAKKGLLDQPSSGAVSESKQLAKFRLAESFHKEAIANNCPTAKNFDRLQPEDYYLKADSWAVKALYKEMSL